MRHPTAAPTAGFDPSSLPSATLWVITMLVNCLSTVVTHNRDVYDVSVSTRLRLSITTLHSLLPAAADAALGSASRLRCPPSPPPLPLLARARELAAALCAQCSRPFWPSAVLSHAVLSPRGAERT
eukprot:scaffold28557_cov34-Tisochrysis_lutea.AAC.4